MQGITHVTNTVNPYGLSRAVKHSLSFSNGPEANADNPMLK